MCFEILLRNVFIWYYIYFQTALVYFVLITWFSFVVYQQLLFYENCNECFNQFGVTIFHVNSILYNLNSHYIFVEMIVRWSYNDKWWYLQWQNYCLINNSSFKWALNKFSFVMCLTLLLNFFHNTWLTKVECLFNRIQA